MPLIAVAIFALLLLTVPIAIAFALPAMLGGPLIGIRTDLFAVTVPFDTAMSFTLLAIPSFVLAGQVMNDGRLMRKLITLAHSIFGWLRGALGYVTIVASALLGAITGSSVATVAAISSGVGEQMVQRGYKRDYVAALTACCGLLGVLIPPSIPLIIYGATVGESVSSLFAATALPGILATIAFMITHRLMLRRVLPAGREQAIGGSEERVRFGPALLRALPALAMPVILIGGIYSGILTPTEAAAAAVVYGIVASLLTRGLKVTKLPQVVLRAAIPSAGILAIIVFTSAFNRLVVLEQIPQRISEFTIGLTHSKSLFLVLVIVLLLVVGMFMETNAAVLLTAPILAPAAEAFGVDPIHFGIIVVSTIELGLITPPFAVNIYVAAKNNGTAVLGMLPYIARFLGVAVLMVLLITFVPILTTWHL